MGGVPSVLAAGTPCRRRLSCTSSPHFRTGEQHVRRSGGRRARRSPLSPTRVGACRRDREDVAMPERSILARAGSGGPERVAWVDAARGASVAAVVLFHVSLWWYLPLQAELWGPAGRVWATVNSYLGSVRMPLLLAVSGLVGAGAIRAGLRDRRTATRAVANGYLYVVWLVVYAVVYALLPGPLPHRVD